MWLTPDTGYQSRDEAGCHSTMWLLSSGGSTVEVTCRSTKQIFAVIECWIVIDAW